MSSSTRTPRSKKKRSGDPSKTQPLHAASIGEDYYDEELGEEDYGGYSRSVPQQYNESEIETTCVRCCGACCCIFLSLLMLAWIVHAIPVATISDIPPFARSMIWMSIAHHTDAWNIAQGNLPPPPPGFGDGRGNFIDVYPPPPPARL